MLRQVDRLVQQPDSLLMALAFERLDSAPQQSIGVAHDRRWLLPWSTFDPVILPSALPSPFTHYLSKMLLPGLAICQTANTTSITDGKYDLPCHSTSFSAANFHRATEPGVTSWNSG